MYPRLLEIPAFLGIGPITVYSYGVLLAAAYLLGLQLALVLGGAIGNLIDRAVQGYVTDFVDVYWRGWHFWAFNVADAAITAGVALMILDIIGVGRHRVSRAV